MVRSVAARFAGSKGGNRTALRRPAQETYLKQIRFVGFFYGDSLLSYGSGYSIDTYRAAAESLYYSRQNLPIQSFKAHRVYLQSAESLSGYLTVDNSISLYLRKISHSFEYSVGYSRSSSGTPCHLED